MSDIILNKFYKFLVESIPGCVVKYNSLASKYETLESKRNGDHFVSASLGTDTLLAYSTLSDSVLQKSGFTLEEMNKYRDSPMDIPKNKVEIVLKHARAEYIANYVELNNYYRMINGLPDIDSEEEIWFEDESIYEEYGLEPCPVHEIPHKFLRALEDRGFIEELKKYYPDAKYLEYVGNRKIDIVSARRADNFEMLYFPNVTDSYSFYRSFLTMYEECRQYFLTVVYNKFFSNKYDEYDGYIGFMIMTMCINRMIVSNFKVFIERDFYDEYSTQVFLNAYGVPYSSRFTLSQMKLLAKNLNILLRTKSTDIALLNVIDLLGYHDFTLAKYYLVKQHMLDGNGDPIFVYKKDPETGEQVLDPDAMYRYHFSRVPVKDTNIQEAVADITNQQSYHIITSLDPYWIEDDELKAKLRDSKFNYIETKYMDISVVYKMYAILFETVYLTRAILDKKNETTKVLVSLAKLSSAEIPVFDVMVFLISTVCKFYRVEPNILTSPSKVLHIAGFNYNADIDAIRQDIANRPEIYDQEILKYINNVVFTKPADINNFYIQIKNLDRKLINLLMTATTLESYRAYRKLYDTLMYIENNEELYALPDGEPSTKFTDYLEFANPPLYNAYVALETDEEISAMIGYVTTRLMNIFTSTKYLKYIQIMDTSLTDALVKLLRYFKSLTVDFRGIDSVILFDSKLMNGAHFYHSMKMGGSNGDNSLEMLMEDWALHHVFWEYAKELSETMELESETCPIEDLGKELVDMYTFNRATVSFSHEEVFGKERMDEELVVSNGHIQSSTSVIERMIRMVIYEHKIRMLSLIHNTDKLMNTLRLYQISQDNFIKKTIYGKLEKVFEGVIERYISMSPKETFDHIEEKFFRMIEQGISEETIHAPDTSMSRVIESTTVDTNLPVIVDHIYKNEYKECLEEFTIWIEDATMIDNHAEVRQCVRDVCKTMIQSVRSDRVSCNEEIEMIWEQ